MSETILLIDDDESFREVTRFHLEEEGYVVRGAADGEVGLRSFEENPTAVVITDLKMPKIDGMELLPRLLARSPDTLVIVVTAFGDVASAVAAMKAGAFEFLPKPFDRDHLKLTVRRAFEHAALRREVRELKGRLGDSAGKELLFRSDAMERVVEVADRVAGADVTVLILGESGTGKELVARRIHRISPRAAGPFVVVNCGAIPRDLLEDELFGHVKGAFTGATRDRRGRFLQADGGTIFLDEISTASPSLQVKLLRILQDFEFEPVGGTKTYKVDSRVVLATNEDLAKLVAEGRFRQDLYYRVNVINIELPSLRERISDIPLLARHFLARVCEESGKKITDFTEETLLAMQRYRWPGNVRELQNIVERVVLLGKGEKVRIEDLPSNMQTSSPLSTAPVGDRTLKQALEEPERQIILEVLERHHWNRNSTADALGVNRTTLYKKMKRLGLEDSPRGRQTREENFSAAAKSGV